MFPHYSDNYIYIVQLCVCVTIYIYLFFWGGGSFIKIIRLPKIANFGIWFIHWLDIDEKKCYSYFCIVFNYLREIQDANRSLFCHFISGSDLKGFDTFAPLKKFVSLWTGSRISNGKHWESCICSTESNSSDWRTARLRRNVSGIVISGNCLWGRRYLFFEN